MKEDNPWLGLRTYEEGDTIYGRIKEIQELSQDILYNVQTTIYGKSGIGKSSILNAGVIPILRKHNFFPVKVRLAHKNTELSYTQQIYSAVFESLGKLKKEKFDSDGKLHRISTVGSCTELCEAINSESEGLWEFFHRHKFFDEAKNPIKPVLIIDQFEELFTLTNEITRTETVNKFFNELADIINDIKPDYIYQQTSATESAEDNAIDTINPEFSDNEILIEEEEETTQNNSLYLTENNCHLVISIREDFLSYLERNINDIPQLKNNRFCLSPLSEDQAAEIIMHPRPGLVTTDVAKEIISKVTGVETNSFEINDTPEIEVDSAILSLFLSEIYNKIEGNAITTKEVENYGKNIVNEYYENTVKKISPESIEYLERRLITDEGRRDNIDKNRAIRHSVTDAELKILKDSRLIREFPWNNEMRIEFIHDILCNVIVQRREERKKFKQQQDIEKQLKLKADKLRNRNKQLASYIVGLVLLIIISSFVIWDGMFRDIDTRYRHIIKKNGWFIGMKELSKENSSYLNCHYILRKKGRWSKYAYAMEARNGYDNLTTQHDFGAYILNQYDETDSKADVAMKQKLSQVCKWNFIADQSGEFLLQEQALDKDGNIIFSYNRSKTKDERKVISTYMDEYGFPIILRDSIYFYLLTTYDKDGYEALQEYYDDKGNPRPNKDGAYKTRWTYTGKGIKKSEASLFFTGDRMIDRWGNCGNIYTEYLDSDSLYETEIISFNADSVPAPIHLKTNGGGITITRYKYDKHNRVEMQTYWDVNGNPAIDSMGVHGLKFEYNRYGQLTHCYRLDTLNNITRDRNGYIDYHREYDQWGNTIVDEMVTEDSTIGQSYKYDAKGILLSQAEYQISGNDTIFSYKYSYNENDRTFLRIHLNSEPPCCVRGKYDEDGNRTMWAYYDSTNTIPIELYGYHLNTTEYNHKESKLLYSDSYYNKDGNRTNNADNWWSYKLIEIDSISKIMTKLNYDSLGNYILGSKEQYTNDFTKLIKSESISENGDTKRTSKNSMFYYAGVYIYNAKAAAGAIGHCCYNEYKEPAYVRESNSILGQYIIYHAFYDNKYYNEKCIEIQPEEYIKSCFIVPIVELYPNKESYGFKDGDVILKCGKWDITQGISDLSEWIKNRYFYIARFNNEINRHEVKRVKIDKNNVIFKTINGQVYYCTEKEEERFKNLLLSIDTSRFEGSDEETDEGTTLTSIVKGRVEIDGKMRKLGLEGEYIILRWCDWEHTQSINDFEKEFNLKIDSEKEILLLPIINNGDAIECGDTFTIKTTADEKLGLRLFDSIVSLDFYNNNIKARYNNLPSVTKKE